MMQLEHGEFAINGYRFGCDHPVGVGNLQATNVSWRVQDQPNPVGNNILMGRDFLDPQPITLGISIRGTDPADTARAAAEFSEEWMTAANRGPGEESVLEVGVHGKTYRAYGRPRPLEIEDSDYFALEITKGQATFDRSDQLWYGDVNGGGGTVTLSISPPQSRGLVFPITFPWTTLTGGIRQGIVHSSGTRRTNDVTVEVQGPNGIRHPVVEGDGWVVDVDVDLKHDETLLIDARREAVTVNGRHVNGKLSRSTRLAQITVPPGDSEFIYRGTDETGSATATITWRSANASLGA